MDGEFTRSVFSAQMAQPEIVTSVPDSLGMDKESWFRDSAWASFTCATSKMLHPEISVSPRDPAPIEIVKRPKATCHEHHHQKFNVAPTQAHKRARPAKRPKAPDMASGTSQRDVVSKL